MNRAMLACAIVGLALAAAGPSTYAASAHTHVYKTRTSVKAANDRIEGRLSSGKKACLGKRLVRAALVPRGSRPVPLGNVRSDAAGRWHYSYESAAIPPHSAIELYVVAKKPSPTALCAGLRAKRGL